MKPGFRNVAVSLLCWFLMSGVRKHKHPVPQTQTRVPFGTCLILTGKAPSSKRVKSIWIWGCPSFCKP